MTATRPERIKLVLDLAFLCGLTQLVLGFALLASPSTVVVGAWFSVVAGAIVIAAGVDLVRGSRLARILVTISLVIAIAADAYIAYFDPAYLWAATAVGLLALTAVILLWTSRASRYFPSAASTATRAASR